MWKLNYKSSAISNGNQQYRVKQNKVFLRNGYTSKEDNSVLEVVVSYFLMILLMMKICTFWKQLICRNAHSKDLCFPLHIRKSGNYRGIHYFSYFGWYFPNFCSKHILWVPISTPSMRILTRSHNPCLEQKSKDKITDLSTEKWHCWRLES